jgi:hypothetical protein
MTLTPAQLAACDELHSMTRRLDAIARLPGAYALSLDLRGLAIAARQAADLAQSRLLATETDKRLAAWLPEMFGQAAE